MKSKPATNHGGKREGAGRKPLGPPLVRVTITVTPADLAALKQLGKNNVSEGVRQALRFSTPHPIDTEQTLV